MHIYFLQEKPPNTRLEVLIQESVKNGHRVSIGSSLFAPLFMPFISINTIHVHSWKLAITIRLVLPFLKDTTTIWTISKLPDFSNAFVQTFFQRFFSIVTKKFTAIYTPSRMIQYRLLTLYSVKSEYIPDGYNIPILPDIRPAILGLRKEQYVVVFAKNIEQLKQITKAARSIKFKKKLVVFSGRTYYGFTSINLPLASRGAMSIVRQAAFVICADPSTSPLGLQAMDSGRNIIATTDPFHEELFGTTAKYYETSDTEQLIKLLEDTLTSRAINTGAQVRAKNHFQWDKIAQEYIRAYKHSRAVLVPFDSIIPKSNFQRAL